MFKPKLSFLGIFFIFAFSTTTFANSASVKVRVESHDKTIAQGNAQGVTFQEAINNFSEENNIDILYNINDGFVAINSVENIRNKSLGSDDGWFAYINRNGEIIVGSTILTSTLEDGDQLVIYYGDPEETEIINVPTLKFDDNTLNFEINSHTNPSGIKIHIITPKKTQRILISDETGHLFTSVNDLGHYQYYAEYYNYSSYPKIVKTETTDFFVGSKDGDKVTRGEAIDFIINQFDVKPFGNTDSFLDIEPNLFYYNEAIIAKSNNILSGYSDGTFRGDNYITLSELSVIISRIKNIDNLQLDSYKTNAPLWATESVDFCISLEIFHESDDFRRLVTIEDLLKIN